MCGRHIATGDKRQCDFCIATENADVDDRIAIARVMYGDESAPLLPPIEDTDEQIAIIDEYDDHDTPPTFEAFGRQEENVWKPRS
jgi:hypothetical protein